MHKAKAFSYGYKDIAAAAGTSIQTIYSANTKKQFDTADFASVVDWIARRRFDELKTSSLQLDPIEQRRAVEAQLGCGVVIQGVTQRGEAIVGIDFPGEAVFKDDRLRVTAQLNKLLPFGEYRDEAGTLVRGWLCPNGKAKPEPAVEMAEDHAPPSQS